MKRLLPLFVLTVFACLAPAAHASIDATMVGSALTLTSSDSGNVNEIYTLRDDEQIVSVKTTPALTNDPDGSALDTTCALSGEEVICDREEVTSVHVVAGQGVDTIHDNQTQGPSVLEGGSGADQITTTSGAEAELLGQAGGDALTSAGAGDTVTGGEDADTLTAGGDKAFDSSDSGGAGNDTFIGNPDLDDRLLAEAGADTYSLGTHIPSAGEGDPTTLQLDEYPDSVSYDAVATPVAVSLDGIANDGRSGEQDNVGANVEIVSGGSAGDLLQAGSNAARLVGSEGADQLLGGPGRDRLSGGAGNDVLRGGGGDDELDDGDFTIAITSSPQPPAGNDVLDGGDGDDSLQSDRGADDLSGGPGIDQTTFNRPIPQAPSVPTPVVPAGFTISLDDVANDGQTGTGEADNVHSDVENIESTDGDDVINGSGAADEISTGGGLDVVNPGGGPDVVDLGAGDDRIEAVDQTTDVIRCRSGSDTANVDLPGVQAPGDQLSDCENVTGTPIPGIANPAPGGDTARPVVTLSIKAIKSEKFLASGYLDVTVSCNEACSAIGKAYKTPAKTRADKSPIGTGRLKLGSGKRTLRITVAKKFRAQLRSKLRTEAQKRRGVKLRIVLAVKDAAGNVTNVSRTVTVKG